jgi:hypothetical protein
MVIERPSRLVSVLLRCWGCLQIPHQPLKFRVVTYQPGGGKKEAVDLGVRQIQPRGDSSVDNMPALIFFLQVIQLCIRA